MCVSQPIVRPWVPPAFLIAGPIQSLRDEVLSITHRGGASYTPENTLATLNSFLADAELMEADATNTNDGRFVLMHHLIGSWWIRRL